MILIWNPTKIIIKKTANENHKIYFEIEKNVTNESAKEKIDKMSNVLNITIEQLIQNKKKNIVSRFLKDIFIILINK